MGKSRRWTLYCVPGDIRDGRIRRRILGRIDALDGAVRGPEGKRWSVSCSSMTSWVCGDSSLMSISIGDAIAASNRVFLSLQSSDKLFVRRRSKPRKRQQLPSPGHLTEFYKFHLRPSPDRTGHNETFRHLFLKKENFKLTTKSSKSQSANYLEKVKQFARAQRLVHRFWRLIFRVDELRISSANPTDREVETLLLSASKSIEEK